VVDLGDDLDVVAAVVAAVAARLAEELGQPAQVFGAAVDRDVCRRGEGVERAAAAAGNDHAARALRHREPAGDPRGRHQRRDGDVEHLHRVVEAGLGGEGLERPPQRVLGEAAGDEVDAGKAGGHKRRRCWMREPQFIIPGP
jgi:hypothetical protein